MVIIKAAALAGVLMLGGGTAAADMCCPPVIETVSCLSGVSSFGPAPCTTGQTQFRSYPFTILDCQPGEKAISAGYRTLLDQLPASGVPVMVQMTPVVGPTGDKAQGYRFVWRPAGGPGQPFADQLGQVRVYITCLEVV